MEDLAKITTSTAIGTDVTQKEWDKAVFEGQERIARMVKEQNEMTIRSYTNPCGRHNPVQTNFMHNEELVSYWVCGNCGRMCEKPEPFDLHRPPELAALKPKKVTRPRKPRAKSVLKEEKKKEKPEPVPKLVEKLLKEERHTQVRILKKGEEDKPLPPKDATTDPLDPEAEETPKVLRIHLVGIDPGWINMAFCHLLVELDIEKKQVKVRLMDKGCHAVCQPEDQTRELSLRASIYLNQYIYNECARNKVNEKLYFVMEQAWIRYNDPQTAAMVKLRLLENTLYNLTEKAEGHFMELVPASTVKAHFRNAKGDHDLNKKESLRLAKELANTYYPANTKVTGQTLLELLFEGKHYSLRST
jgi:hypothetical protein